MAGCFLLSALVTVVIVTPRKVANKNAASELVAVLICDELYGLTVGMAIRRASAESRQASFVGEQVSSRAGLGVHGVIVDRTEAGTLPSLDLDRASHI
ncbi:MAG TPA: hypothetical protein VIX37_05595 [Candidatus Sulfotelmatobacter sp.]